MHPNDTNFRLFRLLHGDNAIDPLEIAKIPTRVRSTMGWRSSSVFLTTRDAQKIRFHPMHGMDATKGMHLPLVVSHGDYFQSTRRGSDLEIEVILREPNSPKRAYFLVLARDKSDTGIFIRTFYFTSKLSVRKMDTARVLLNQSDQDLRCR